MNINIELKLGSGAVIGLIVPQLLTLFLSQILGI
jgi:hypothetical protein